MRRKVSGYHIPMYVLEIVSLFHPFRNTTTHQKLGDAISDIILVKHQVAVLIAVLRRPRSLRTIRTVGSFRPARMSYQVGQTTVAEYTSPMYIHNQGCPGEDTPWARARKTEKKIYSA